jgi:hypothetical protein
VCVRTRVGARMQMKGDCGNLKCNPPLENPAYGPAFHLSMIIFTVTTS